jgi:hypothetical protein
MANRFIGLDEAARTLAQVCVDARAEYEKGVRAAHPEPEMVEFRMAMYDKAEAMALNQMAFNMGAAPSPMGE